MKGRDDKIIQATQKELNLAVRPSTCSTVSHISYLSTNQVQNSETEIARIINDMYDNPCPIVEFILIRDDFGSETVHQDFLERYAILEDRKRKIMAVITEKQKELIVCPLAFNPFIL